MASSYCVRRSLFGRCTRGLDGNRHRGQVRGLLWRLLLIAAMTCSATTAYAEIDCKKALAKNAILGPDIVAIASVPERFMFFFDSGDRDVYPGARLRLQLKTPLTVEDLTCLDQHVPIVFIDGFRFPRQPIRYQPPNSSGGRSATPTSSQSNPNEAAGGNSAAATVQAFPAGNIDTIEFQLEIADESRPIWQKLHKNPRPERSVEIGLGFLIAAEGVPAGVELRRVKIVGDTLSKGPMRAGIAPSGAYTAAWASFWIVLLAAVVLAASKPKLYRFEGNREFTQGAAQALAWFSLVLAMAVHLWLLSGSTPAISPKLLALIGMSGGTLAIALQLNRKTFQLENTAKAESGIQAWQAGLVNVFVMLTFVIQSHETLTLAEIDATWIGVLALCNGVLLFADRNAMTIR
jgi:hypothetical protein